MLKKFIAQTQSGSALVFTLILLSLMLVISLGVVSVAVVERKNASNTGKSTQAFQVADSGIEIIMQKVRDGKNTLQALKNDLLTNGWNSCTAGILTKNDLNGGTVQLSFDSESGTQITDCENNTDMIASAKSVGTKNTTSRAIDAAVAAGVFRGALVEIASTRRVDVPNDTDNYPTWDSVDNSAGTYDTDNIFDDSGKQYFTIPEGVSYVRFSLTTCWEPKNNATDTTGRRTVAIIRNDGQRVVSDIRSATEGTGASDATLTSPVIKVTPGQKFRVFVWQNSTITRRFGCSSVRRDPWFAMEIVR